MESGGRDDHHAASNVIVEGLGHSRALVLPEGATPRDAIVEALGISVASRVKRNTLRCMIHGKYVGLDECMQLGSVDRSFDILRIWVEGKGGTTDPPLEKRRESYTLDKITDMANTLEQGWTVSSDWNHVDMKQLGPIVDNWGGTGGIGTVEVNKAHCAIRLIKLSEADKPTIRYLTPQKVWAYTCEGGTMVKQPAVPLPPECLAQFADLIQPVPTDNMLELILALHDIASTGAAACVVSKIKTTTREGVLTFSGHTARAGENAWKCPVCGENHATGWRISDDKPGALMLECLLGPESNAKPKRKVMRLPEYVIRIVGHSLTEPQDAPAEEKTELANGAGLRHLDMRKFLLHRDPSGVRNNHEEMRTDDIGVLSWNTDGTFKNSRDSLLNYATERNIDIICLQEMSTADVDPTALHRRGYNIYRHNKVAILVKVDTAEKLLQSHVTIRGKETTKARVWRSEKYDSMGVTLTTPQGTIFVASAYLPANVDSMSEDNREKVELQHQELNATAAEHTQAVLMMDANETVSLVGRVTVPCDNKQRKISNFLGFTTGRHDATSLHVGGDGNNPTPPKGVPSKSAMRMNVGETCMACYAEGFTDMAAMPEALGTDPYTHYMPTADMTGTIKSKIDYAWVSSNLVTRVHDVRLVDTSRWKNGRKKRYHKAISTNIAWKGIWQGTDESNGPLQGEAIPLGLRMERAGETEKIEIAKRVEELLSQRWATLKNTRKGRLHPKRVLNILRENMEMVLMKAADSVVGTYQRQNGDGSGKEQRNKVLAVWDWVFAQIERLPRHSNALPAEVESQRERLRDIGIDVPDIRTDDKQKVREWLDARDYHRAQAAGFTDNLTLTDAEALANPRKLTNQICRPFSTTTISSLRTGDEIITTDAGIEAELTKYVKNIAGKEESILDLEDTDERRRIDERCNAVNEHLVDIIKAEVSDDELRRALTNLKGKAAAVGVPSLLIKIACTTTWKEQRVLSNRRKKAWHNAQTALQKIGMPHETRPPQTEEITVTPRHATQLLKWIIQQSFVAKDLPDMDKNTIITGLPKLEGQVNSTDTIRPISVGPAIGRLINHIVAHRMSGAIVKHGLLDQASYAFLPGKSIHGAISGVLECLKQSHRAGNNKRGRACYALFYDMSKAYDTVRWSSIQRALVRLGAPDDLIDFVMRSLRGSKVRMKTNIKGRTTPVVQMHSAIKQGCPLAPLLFTIIMDELHRGYRCIDKAGYEVDKKSRIFSRGYCDDTVILAQDMDTLSAMHEYTLDFFNQHGFRVNASKTHLIGRNRDGTVNTRSLTGRMKVPARPEGHTVRYLGIHFNMDLTWGKQISVMNGSVMNLASHLRHRRITLLQGAVLVRHTLAQKMGVGIRHADIPATVLGKWDKVITGSMTKRTGLPLQSIHSSSLFSVMGILTLSRQYLLEKLTHILNKVTTEDELKDTYRRALRRIMEMGTDEAHAWVDQDVRALEALAKQDITVVYNQHSLNESEHVADRRDIPECEIEEHTYKNISLPTHMSPNSMWDADIEERGVITFCTDGSTDPSNREQPSGAALIMVTDNLKEAEYSAPSITWRMEQNDNYVAELCAIGRALRSAPASIDIVIHTDSQSAIDAIHTHATDHTRLPTIKCEARPYLRYIQEALRVRHTKGAKTTILHVRSHTGVRSLPSIGNEAADRDAGKARVAGETEADINKMKYELEYVVHLGQGENAIVAHGNVRRAVRSHLLQAQLTEWGSRRTKGQMVRQYGEATRDVIKQIWRSPTTTKIKYLLDVLNQGNPCEKVQGKWKPKLCDRCNTGARQTLAHRLIDCPTVADLWNQADEDIWKLLKGDEEKQVENDVTREAKMLASVYVKNRGLRPRDLETVAAYRIAYLQRHHQEARRERDYVTGTLEPLVDKAAREAISAVTMAKEAAIAASRAYDSLREMLGQWSHLACTMPGSLTGRDWQVGDLFATVGRKQGTRMDWETPPSGSQWTDDVLCNLELWWGRIIKRNRTTTKVEWLEPPPEERSPNAERGRNTIKLRRLHATTNLKHGVLNDVIAMITRREEEDALTIATAVRDEIQQHYSNYRKLTLAKAIQSKDSRTKLARLSKRKRCEVTTVTLEEWISDTNVSRTVGQTKSVCKTKSCLSKHGCSPRPQDCESGPRSPDRDGSSPQPTTQDRSANSECENSPTDAGRQHTPTVAETVSEASQRIKEVRTLLGHVKITWGTNDQNQANSTLTICNHYDASAYRSMTQDRQRNKVYSNAIRNLPRGSKCIDVGTGAYAPLATMAMHSIGNCIAMEINPEAARTAKATLQGKDGTWECKYGEKGGWQVINGDAASCETLLDANLTRNDQVHILHETFGLLASSEGGPKLIRSVVANVERATGVKPVVLPSEVMTFIAPVTLKQAKLIQQELYLTDKLLLVKKFPFSKQQMTTQCGLMERFDLNNNIDLKQTHSSKLTAKKAGHVHALAAFIHAGMLADRPRRSTNYCQHFPYENTNVSSGNRTENFTSREDSQSYATNWRNPLFLLPKPMPVQAGDLLWITTVSDSTTDRPHYKFTVRNERTCTTMTMHVDFDDLYPDFDEQKTTNDQSTYRKSTSSSPTMSQQEKANPSRRRLKRKAGQSKQRMYILLPTAQDQGYTWGHLEVRKVSSRHSGTGKGMGNGLFATNTLAEGCMIPVLGRPYWDKGNLPTNLSHCYQYDKAIALGEHTGAIVDGHPRIATYKGVGCRGLAIALMANEPKKVSQANAIFARNFLVTIKKIRKNEQILVCYGWDRDREEARKQAGYNVIIDTEDSPKISSTTHDIPSAGERAWVTRSLLRQCSPPTWRPCRRNLINDRPIGLPNLGNTCHLAAVLQALIPVWRRLGGPDFGGLTAPLMALARMETGGSSYEERLGLVTQIAKDMEIGVGRQEGAFQTYLTLMDSALGVRNRANMGNIIHKTTQTCPNPGCAMAHTYTTMNHIYLPATMVQQSTSFQHALDSVTASSELLRDYKCTTCNTRANVRQDTSIEAVGESVMVAVTPRQATSNHELCSHMINPTMKNLTIGTSPDMYNLESVITYEPTHTTNSRDMGHYYTLTQRGDAWYKANDSKVSRLSHPHDLIRSLQYVTALVYRRTSGTDGLSGQKEHGKKRKGKSEAQDKKCKFRGQKPTTPRASTSAFAEAPNKNPTLVGATAPSRVAENESTISSNDGKYGARSPSKQPDVHEDTQEKKRSRTHAGAHTDVHTDIHIDTRAHTHTDTHTNTHTDTRRDTHRDAHRDMRVNDMHSGVHVDTRTDAHTDTHTNTHTDTHTDEHTSTRADKRTDTNTRTRAGARACTPTDPAGRKDNRAHTSNIHEVMKHVQANEPLNDLDMKEILEFIKNRNSVATTGLDDPILHSRATYAAKTRERMEAHGAGLQVLYLHPPGWKIGHWVVAEWQKGRPVKIYDTLQSVDTVDGIASLCKNLFGEREIEIVGTTQQQTGILDCGLFAIAIIIDILGGERDPSMTTYVQGALRTHLKRIVTDTTGNITPFPVRRGTRRRQKGRQGGHPVETDVTRDQHMPKDKWGDEEGRGYLYNGKAKDPPIYLDEARWLPKTYNKEKTHRKGLFSKYGHSRNCIITTYAGRGKYVDNTQCSTEAAAYYKTLIRIADSYYVIDGFREPVDGYGMAQYCNDKRGADKANAKLITVSSPGGRGQGAQMGIYLKATRDIRPGEEITISYGHTYFKQRENTNGKRERKRNRGAHSTEPQKIPRTSPHSAMEKRAGEDTDDEVDIQMEEDVQVAEVRDQSEPTGEPKGGRSPPSTHVRENGSFVKLIRKLRAAHKKKQFNKLTRDTLYCTDIERHTRKHLGITQVANQHLTQVQQSTSWHTGENVHTNLGACGGSLVEYLRHKNTWINAPRDAAPVLLLSAEVVATSPSTTVAMLVVKNENNLEMIKMIELMNTNVACVKDYKPEEIDVMRDGENFWDLEAVKENIPLTLVIITSNTLTDMAHRLRSLTLGHKDKTPHDARISGYFITHERTEINKYPSLLTYRQAVRPIEFYYEHEKVKAATIGHMYKGTKDRLRHMGHKRIDINTDLIKKIENIFINTSLRSFMRYELWMRGDPNTGIG